MKIFICKYELIVNFIKNINNQIDHAHCCFHISTNFTKNEIKSNKPLETMSQYGIITNR